MEALNVERIGAFQGSGAQGFRGVHFEPYIVGHLKIAYRYCPQAIVVLRSSVGVCRGGSAEVCLVDKEAAARLHSLSTYLPR